MRLFLLVTEPPSASVFSLSLYSNATFCNRKLLSLNFRHSKHISEADGQDPPPMSNWWPTWQHLHFATACKRALRNLTQHLCTCSEQSLGHSSLLHSAWLPPLPVLAVTEEALDLVSSGLAKTCTSNVSGFWLLLLSAIQLRQTPQSFKRTPGCKLILKHGLYP